MSVFIKIINLCKRHAFNLAPKLSERLTKRKELVKFFIAGSTAGGADLLFLFILHGLLKMSIVLATSIAFLLAFGVSFNLQKFWAFNNHDRKYIGHQLFTYLAVALVNLYLNGHAMYILVDHFKVWYILAQIIVALVLGVFSFIIYKFIIFRERKCAEIKKADTENNYEVNSQESTNR